MCFNYSDVEFITCCIGIFDVAKEEQAKDIDSYHICMCGNCGNHAFHHKVCCLSLYMLVNDGEK